MRHSRLSSAPGQVTVLATLLAACAVLGLGCDKPCRIDLRATQCDASNGLWTPSLGGGGFCNCSTSDGGASCSSESDCTGDCLVDVEEQRCVPEVDDLHFCSFELDLLGCGCVVGVDGAEWVCADP